MKKHCVHLCADWDTKKDIRPHTELRPPRIPLLYCIEKVNQPGPCTRIVKIQDRAISTRNSPDNNQSALLPSVITANFNQLTSFSAGPNSGYFYSSEFHF